MTNRLRLSTVAVMLVLAGCVSIPSGPSSMALPGSGMGWDRFRADEADCRGFAQSQVGTTPDQAAVTRRYDGAYLQCMYAKGHKIPVYGNYTSQSYGYGGNYAPPPPPPPPR